MSESKDILDVLREKKNLEQKRDELLSKKDLLPAERVILEEVNYKIANLNAKISKP